MKAFAVARPEIEKRVVAAPSSGVELSVLAIADAGVGHSQQAVEEGRRACDLSPFEVNNFEAPTVRCNLAVVYAWTGQNDLAIGELSKLINGPAMGTGIAQPTYGDFRLNPLWDPLRMIRASKRSCSDSRLLHLNKISSPLKEPREKFHVL